MKNYLITVVSFFLGLFAYYVFDINDAAYTLYRNSITTGGEGMRIHIATFDAKEKLSFGFKYDDYNRENCNLAASLFQRQPGTDTKFWCEKGRYKK